jgi:hypothetical protein
MASHSDAPWARRRRRSPADRGGQGRARRLAAMQQWQPDFILL